MVTIYCTPHCDTCDSGSCEHAEEARQRHHTALATGLVVDERSMTAEQFSRSPEWYNAMRGKTMPAADPEWWFMFADAFAAYKLATGSTEPLVRVEFVTKAPCKCVCHRVGLMGLMCCPCTVQALDELVNGKPQTNIPLNSPTSSKSLESGRDPFGRISRDGS